MMISKYWLFPSLCIALACAQGDAKDPYTDMTEDIEMLVIHHTSEPTLAQYNGASSIRGIQDFHMDDRGWSDIGYHYLVGPEGEIYEGRPDNVQGAHTRNANRGKVGIAMVGDFQNNDAVPGPAWDSLVKLSAYVAEKYSLKTSVQDKYDQIDVTDQGYVTGHRQWVSDTDCPGDDLFSRLVELVLDIEEQRNPSETLRTVVIVSGGIGVGTLLCWGGLLLFLGQFKAAEMKEYKDYSDRHRTLKNLYDVSDDAAKAELEPPPPKIGMLSFVLLGKRPEGQLQLESKNPLGAGLSATKKASVGSKGSRSAKKQLEQSLLVDENPAMALIDSKKYTGIMDGTLTSSDPGMYDAQAEKEARLARKGSRKGSKGSRKGSKGSRKNSRKKTSDSQS